MIQLTEPQRTALLDVLSGFSPPVERVDIFGSRATGRARPGSDVDLVVEGRVDHALLARIGAALESSYLSLFSDVAAYAVIEDSRFREEVARTATPLFSKEELRRRKRTLARRRQRAAARARASEA